MMNKLNKKFLKENFKRTSNRGYFIAFKSHPKPLCRKNGLITEQLWNDHEAGKITLFLLPSKNEICYWCSLDIDVLKKGETLEVEYLKTKNWFHLPTLKWCLNKLGLSDDNYLFVLNGRGFHLHFYFIEGIPSEIAYDFIKIIKDLFEQEFYEATGVEHKWDGIDLRPDKPTNANACIQLPGYNFKTQRFSLPFRVDNRGVVEVLISIPVIQKIPTKTVLNIIMEFKKD